MVNRPILSDLEVLPEAEGGVRGQGDRPLAGVVEDALVGRGDLEAAPVDVQQTQSSLLKRFP